MNGINTKIEGSIQSEISKYIEQVGGFLINPKTSTYSKKGIPDLSFCYRGLWVSIEVKKPGEKPTKLQKLRLEQVRNAGGIAICTDNLKEVKELINDISTIQLYSKPEQRESIQHKFEQE